MDSASKYNNIFQSTLPARWSDGRKNIFWLDAAYFNPRSPQGGATDAFAGWYNRNNISIHAPRKVERRFTKRLKAPKPTFQSTLPARWSDGLQGRAAWMRGYFNPRSPQGGATIRRGQSWHMFLHFNPRSPQGGATCAQAEILYRCAYFNPRSPRGGATIAFNICRKQVKISIHAPHEGERLARLYVDGIDEIISIHAPHEGERQH